MVILYSLLILSLSLGVITKIEFLPAASVYLYDVLAFLIILTNSKYIFFFLKANYKKLTAVLLFLVIGFIGIPFHAKNNIEFLVSLSYLARLVLYLLLLIPILRMSSNSPKVLRKILLCSGIIFISFGYVQYFFYPNLRNLFYLGWDEHLYRLFSTFLDPNFAGIFIALTFFLYADFFREYFKKSSILLRVLAVVGFLYIVSALFLTYSRSSLIAFIISVLVLLILLKKKKLIFFFIAFFALSLIILPKNFGGEGVNLLRTSSLIARTGEFNKAWIIFLKNPLFGVGFNTLRYMSVEYGYVSAKDAISSHAAAGVPNSYLYILATTGMAGIGVSAVILRELVKHLWSKKSSSVFVIASFVVVLVGALFENFLFYAPITLWLIILLGITFNEKFEQGMSVGRVKAKSR